MEEIIKVLHIGADNIGYGGRSVIAFNLAQHMNNKIIHNDFLALKKINNYFERLINDTNGKILEVSIIKSTPRIKFEVERTRKIIKAIKTEKYDIVHIHADHAYEAMKSVWIAQKAGVKKFVIHAHTAGNNKDYSVLKKCIIHFCQIIIARQTYMQVACSNEAALYLFGKKNRNKKYIINDGIDSSLFKYDSSSRKKKREYLGFKEDELVIGCVGRLAPSKNHIYLLRVFEEIKKIEPNARLILIGDGELKEKLRNVCKNKGLTESVNFLGNRNDVPELMQAMDVFVLPSLFEGFGIVNIEAQCAGLPCVLSDGIPKSVKITELVTFLPLELKPEIWAETILYLVMQNQRADRSSDVCNTGFDIRTSGKKVEEIYCKMMDKDTEIKKRRGLC